MNDETARRLIASAPVRQRASYLELSPAALEGSAAGPQHGSPFEAGRCRGSIGNKIFKGPYWAILTPNVSIKVPYVSFFFFRDQQD